MSLIRSRRFLTAVRLAFSITLGAAALLIVAGINLVPVAAVSAAPTGTSAGPLTNITIFDFGFNPAVVTITAGSSVKWTNSSPITHTTTSDTGVWDSGNIGPSGTFTQIFNVPGTYPYHCTIHSTLMKGTIVVIQAPTSVDVAGPTDGSINTTYTFTATVNPLTATQPITFMWQATAQSPVIHASGLSDTLAFTWPTTGTQTITVTATNVAGTVTNTQLITISVPVVVPPTSVDIIGPADGSTNTAYNFIATVNPPTTTQPITFVWQATGQSPITDTGGLSDTVAFTWPTTGTQLITVTTSNTGGAVTNTQLITISPVTVIQPPTNISVVGPAEGLINIAYTFTATVSPLTTTQPITFMWQATGQSPAIYVAGLSDSIAFTWPTTGTQLITVTASNSGGAVTNTQLITISPVIVIQPPTNINVVGSAEGLINTAYAFTATVSPLTTTQPITFMWQATGQSPVTHTSGLSDTLAFTWPTTGTQTITVTSTNVGGTVTNTRLITISTPVSVLQPPASVDIAGSTDGSINTAHTFTATVSPLTTTQPITFMWQATGQPPVIHTGGLSDSMAFTWPGTGHQVITVTAMNTTGAVTNTRLITIFPPADVSIIDFAFRPQNLTVTVGSTVTWINNGGVAHTTTSDTGLWDSGSLEPGDMFSQTFNAPGRYPYHCSIHGFFMSGVIIVTARVYLPLVMNSAGP